MSLDAWINRYSVPQYGHVHNGKENAPNRRRVRNVTSEDTRSRAEKENSNPTDLRTDFRITFCTTRPSDTFLLNECFVGDQTDTGARGPVRPERVKSSIHDPQRHVKSNFFKFFRMVCRMKYRGGWMYPSEIVARVSLESTENMCYPSVVTHVQERYLSAIVIGPVTFSVATRHLLYRCNNSQRRMIAFKCNTPDCIVTRFVLLPGWAKFKRVRRLQRILVRFLFSFRLRNDPFWFRAYR